MNSANKTESKPFTTIEETVYPDGSGACGTYVVYGRKFAGINNGEGKVTVHPLGIDSGYMSRKEKGMIASAVKKLEAHMAALCA
jgi:hypothetical protein